MLLTHHQVGFLFLLAKTHKEEKVLCRLELVVLACQIFTYMFLRKKSALV